MQNVDHLVLSGGAMKGIAFLGALECFQRRQSLSVSGLKVLVGASVGALICSLLSVGYTPSQLFKVAMEIDFDTLAHPELNKIFSHYGLDSGHLIMEKLRNLFLRKGIDPDITFAQHFAHTQKHLVITVSCLGKGVCYFDHTNEPDLAVLKAIRMSIAFPGYFTPVRYKGHFYVDGGLLDNVPIAFLDNVPSDRILVIRTSIKEYSDNNQSESEIAEDNAENYMWLFTITVLREMERLRLESTQMIRDIHRCSTVQIDVTQISSLISVSQSDKTALLKDGYLSAIEYLKSDVWLELQIEKLPYEALRRVWREVHRRNFRKVMNEVVVRRVS